MPVDPNAAITITAFDWVPDFAKGLVRDLRVRWALEEVGQPYNVRFLSQGEQKSPEHCRLQPFGQVPTYEEGDLVLYESGAIVLHIAREHDGLLPADADARVRATAWLFAALNTVEPPISDYVNMTIFEYDRPWAREREPVTIGYVRDRLKDVSRRLGDREWIEDRFSAGDLMMISVLRNLRATDLVAEHANLKRYQERGEARPAFQRALEAQLAGFTGEAPPQFIEWVEQWKKARAA